jgi:tellurite resistance protein TerC
VLFAVDSVPAVLAISHDLFIVYTSNIMAILGLRALYFLLAGMMSRFQYLDIGLAIILIFIGAKMVSSSWIKVPNLLSLGVIGSVLTLSVVFSLLRQPKGQSVSEAAISPQENGDGPKQPSELAAASPDPSSDPEPLARSEARKPASDARRAFGEED